MNDPELTEVVRVKQSTHVCLVCFLNRADQGVTGVVEDYVKPAEMRVSLLNGFPDLIGIDHVERQGQNGVAEAFAYPLGFLFQGHQFDDECIHKLLQFHWNAQRERYLSRPAFRF